MTTYFYSSSTKGFYVAEIHPEMPNDVIEITEDYYNSLVEGQSNNMQISADSQGYPILITPVIVPYTKEQNKEKASKLLANTDWTIITDVSNPQMSNPYLANQSEFIVYRNSVRQHAINPVEGNVDWATLPEENWVKV